MMAVMICIEFVLIVIYQNESRRGPGVRPPRRRRGGRLHIFFGNDIERLRVRNHFAGRPRNGFRHGAQGGGGKVIQPVVENDIDGAIDQGQFTVA